MPRCAKCGKVNRDGSIFCQDCGSRLNEAAPTPVGGPGSGQVEASGGIAPPVCTACGAVNQAGQNFCKQCGTPLPKPAAAAPRPAAAPPSGSPSGGPPAGGAPPMPRVITTCPHCGGDTPPGMPFCQHCGHKLPGTAAVPVSRVPVEPPDAVAATMAAPSGQPVPTPPAVPVAAAPAPAAPPQTPTPPAGLRVGSGLTAKQASGGAAFAATMMPTSGQLDQILAGIPARGATGQTPAAPAAAPAPATPAAAEPEESGRKTSAQPTTGSTLVEEPVPTARLILVQSDGSDGTVYDLSAEQVDLGRLEGQLTFPDDRFLAARHARLERREDRYVVVPLDHRNGIYVRLREPVDLGDADTFLVGKQVFRFERLADVERDPAPAIEHGVHLFGTPGRQPWARLVQVTTAGIVRDVYYLTRAETVMGREEGDYVFPDDEFMSRRHVAISESRNRARIEDLGSSNGTYLRLRGERELRPGDMVRLGDQLLRYETIT